MSVDESPIIGMFLAKFDMKKGNIIEWEEGCSEFQNLEFKALPSGIHEANDDVVNFVVPQIDNPLKFCHGIAYFAQNGFDQDIRVNGQVDRSQVRMYSLGFILNVEELETDKYVADLQNLLTTWMDLKDYSVFELFSNYFKNRHIPTNIRLTKKKMIDYMPFWITKLGPLIYTIWKACLINKRIIILNPAGGSFDMCNSLALCLSKLSDACTSTNAVTPQELLYTIGAIDIDHLSQVEKGYIACTSDEVLLLKEDIYDIVIRLPPIGSIEDMIDVDSHVTILASAGAELKATHHDLKCFTFFFQGFIEDSIVSDRINTQTEPVSWVQFLIDNFYFWLTAGMIKPRYYQDIITTGEPIESNGTSHILEYFERRTSLLYKSMNLLLVTGEHIILPSDLLSLQLDCFSLQDYRFVEILALKWFQRSISVKRSDYWNLF